MTQQRLFRLAPETLIFQAIYVPGEGWQLAVRMRRQNEPWNDAYEMRYRCLTTAELADVIAVEAATQLGAV